MPEIPEAGRSRQCSINRAVMAICCKCRTGRRVRVAWLLGSRFKNLRHCSDIVLYDTHPQSIAGGLSGGFCTDTGCLL